MTPIPHCSECGKSVDALYLTVCGHPLCFSCAGKPLHNTSHICACETPGYGPNTLLRTIQKDREREKEQVAA